MTETLPGGIIQQENGLMPILIWRITTMRCSHCGFEDEGNFCSSCGKPLTQERVSLQSQLIYDIPWHEKCPACKIGKLISEKQKMAFGLLTSDHYVCGYCKADFQKNGDDTYTLGDMPDKNHPFWQRFGRTKLNTQHIKNLAYGENLDSYGINHDISVWLNAIENNCAIPLLDSSPSVMLKKGEVPFLSLENVQLKEPRSVRVTHGGHAGPRIRVAKGISFGMGTFGAKSESHEEIRVIDQGNLLLTNKRLVFSGGKRSTNIQLKKVVSIDPFDDGIAVRREGKQKTEYFVGLKNGYFVVKDEEKTTYRYQVNGQDLMNIILGVVEE